MQSHTSIKPIACPIHSALTRPILLAGAERALVLFNMTCIVMLLFGIGLYLISILLAIFLGLIGHPILVRLAKHDPYFSSIALRHLRYKAFYSARSSRLAHSWNPKS